MLSQPPVVLSTVKGVKVCGKRAGPSYANVPLNTDLTVPNKCPSGYQSCGNAQTKAEHTWCIPDTLTSADCPITKIEFIDQG